MSARQWVIARRHLTYLVASLLIYRDYRLVKTAASAERTNTVQQVETLLLDLHLADVQGTNVSISLSGSEAAVLRLALQTLRDVIKRKPTTRAATKEMNYLNELLGLLDAQIVPQHD